MRHLALWVYVAAALLLFTAGLVSTVSAQQLVGSNDPPLVRPVAIGANTNGGAHIYSWKMPDGIVCFEGNTTSCVNANSSNSTN